MKTASDVMLAKIVQKVKNLLDNHNHDGVYSNGARRTYNSGKQAEGTTNLATGCVNEKFYFVQIGTSNGGNACATVCFDWQMIPSSGGIEIYYTLASNNSTTIEHSSILVTRSNGVTISCLGSDRGHYIKHVCAYI